MAEKLKKLTGQSKKIWIIIGVIVVIIILFLYLRSGSEPTTGQNSSSVTSVPSIQNVPGGKVSPEYYKALLQSNSVAAQKAQAFGQSSIATLVNTDTPGFAQPSTCVQKCCDCQSPTVKGTIGDWAASGKISKATQQALESLNKQNLSVGDYESALEQMVKSGQITPEQARKLLEQYKKEHGSDIAKAGAQEIDTLIKSGALPLDAANTLLDLQKNGASVDSYAQELAALVKSGKISKELAAQLLADYKKKHGGLETVSLDQLVNAGLPGSFTAGSYNKQQLVNPSLLQSSGKPQFQDGQVASAPMSAQEQVLLASRQTQIQALSASMTTQAGGIIKGGEPTVQNAMVSAPETPEQISAERAAARDAAGQDGAGGHDQPPIVKAGDIEFAVLDTAVDSDYPTSPVMATIVQGNLKGGKLIGSLSKGGTTNNDRVILSFNLLNMPDWPKPVAITAVAIDPDTARSALATSVDYHYLTRYGAMFASAFLAGYGQTFTQAGQTVVPTGTTPYVIPAAALSPTGRIFAGLGQVGTQTSTAAQQYFNTPPTVKVKSGVGLGVLFMQNVSSTAPYDKSTTPSQQPLLTTNSSSGEQSTISGQQVTQSNKQ